MAYELLVAAGSRRAGEAPPRSESVRHAALQIPGARTFEFAETPCAAVALVSCSPAGGGAGALTRDGDAVRAAVGMSGAGLAASATDAMVGAEAGHVVVTAHPDGRVSVRNDGVGIVPLFWAEVDGRFYASTHLASLVSLGVPPDIDQQGMLEYLAMLHPLGERTILRDAQLLPAAATLTWRPEAAASVTSRPLFLPSAEQFTDAEAVGAYREVWRTVIADILERGAGSRTTVSLSGGLDSRAVAATVRGLGAALPTFTYGTHRNRETRTAARVAARLGLPHLTLPLTDDRLLHHCSETVTRLDGAHTPAELYDTWFLDSIRQYTDTVINGHAGGPVWGDEKAHGLTDRDQIANRVWARYAGVVPYITPFLNDPVLGSEFGTTVHASIRGSLDPWDFAERSDMITFWQVANRQTRWGNMMVSAMRRGGLQVETPFLDGRFLEYLTRVRPEQRRNGALYLRIHREVFPETADIPRSDDGNPPNALTHLYWTGDESFQKQWLRMTRDHPTSGLRRGGRRATARAASLLRSRTGISSIADALDHQASVFPADLLLRTRPAYAERLAAMLAAGAESKGMLDGERLADAADHLASGRPVAPALVLARLATAALWQVDFERRHRQMTHHHAPPTGRPDRVGGS